MPIKIGTVQVERIAKDRAAGFRDKLIRYLHGYRSVLRRPDAAQADLAAAADAALARCEALGIAMEVDIATYAARALEFGTDWETQERFSLSHSVLNDATIDPDDRISRMQQAEMAAEFDPYATKEIDLFEEAG